MTKNKMRVERLSTSPVSTSLAEAHFLAIYKWVARLSAAPASTSVAQAHFLAIYEWVARQERFPSNANVEITYSPLADTWHASFNEEYFWTWEGAGGGDPPQGKGNSLEAALADFSAALMLRP